MPFGNSMREVVPWPSFWKGIVARDDRSPRIARRQPQKPVPLLSGVSKREQPGTFFPGVKPFPRYETSMSTVSPPSREQ